MSQRRAPEPTTDPKDTDTDKPSWSTSRRDAPQFADELEPYLRRKNSNYPQLWNRQGRHEAGR